MDYISSKEAAFRIRELRAQHDMAFDGGWPIGR